VGAAMKYDQLTSLAGHFALLSLFAIGGANSAVPEMHRLAVEVEHWMSERQFTDIFAIAQVTPGPNVIIVTLIGYHVAGLAGALVATVAMCGPTCVLAFYVGQIWERFKDRHWRNAIQAGLVPLSIGFMAASAYVVTRAADISWVAAGLTAVVGVLMYFGKLNPLLLLAAGGLIGLAGLL